jgi:hypothetical protein
MDQVTVILPAQPRRPENPCDISSFDPHVSRGLIVSHFKWGRSNLDGDPLALLSCVDAPSNLVRQSELREMIVVAKSETTSEKRSRPNVQGVVPETWFRRCPVLVYRAYAD